MQTAFGMVLLHYGMNCRLKKAFPLIATEGDSVKLSSEETVLPSTLSDTKIMDPCQNSN